MEFFVDFMQTVAQLPDLVSFILSPALLLVAGFLLAVFRVKRAYLPVALALGGAGIFLLACEKSGSFAVVLGYAALYLVLAVLVSLFFLIPFPTGKGKDRSQELYEKFHVDLDEPQAGSSFGEGETYSGEESGLRLKHANELVEKLQKCELSASDRLEVDALSHTLSGYGERELNAEELRALNDCLATVLKLTAKYKL